MKKRVRISTRKLLSHAWDWSFLKQRIITLVAPCSPRVDRMDEDEVAEEEALPLASLSARSAFINERLRSRGWPGEVAGFHLAGGANCTADVWSC